MFDTITLPDESKTNSYTGTNGKVLKVHDPKESKRDRFHRLLKRRMDGAKDQMRLIKNLLENPYTYGYTHEDVEQIVGEFSVIVEDFKTFWKAPKH